MDFVTFAQNHGLVITSLYASERIKRCGTVDKPRSTNGAYFYDGQKGWVFNWAGDARVIWYDDPNQKPWTMEEKFAWMKKRQEQSTKQNQTYELAAERAEIILRASKLDNHPYLEFKGFKDMKGFVHETSLMIPMRNVVTNKLQGLQEIYWDEPNRKYEKKMLAGMRAKNAVHWLGDRDAKEKWLVEGYATGMSLHHALRSVGMQATVVVCFSANNLVQVSAQIKGDRYIFADHDKSKTGENSAIETGLPWTMADEEGMDANDLHDKYGLIAVVKKVMELRKKVLLQQLENTV
jgi:putative DNA primase/helicase